MTRRATQSRKSEIAEHCAIYRKILPDFRNLSVACDLPSIRLRNPSACQGYGHVSSHSQQAESSVAKGSGGSASGGGAGVRVRGRWWPLGWGRGGWRRRRMPMSFGLILEPIINSLSSVDPDVGCRCEHGSGGFHQLVGLVGGGFERCGLGVGGQSSVASVVPDTGSAASDSGAASDLGSLLESLSQQWITSSWGNGFDTQLNAVWQDFGGTGILIGNGADGIGDGTLAEATGGAGGLWFGDGGDGVTDASRGRRCRWGRGNRRWRPRRQRRGRRSRRQRRGCPTDRRWRARWLRR